MTARAGRALRPDAGFALLALLYAGLVHQGVAPGGEAWRASRGFLLEVPALAWLWQSMPFALACLVLPAAALAAAAWLTGRSALARTAVLAAGLATLLFAFYAQSPTARQVWKLFGWRGSAVLACTAAAVACACASPWLAASWRRQPPWLRGLLWLPPGLLVIAFLRNATGTDPSLPFRLSPWPAVAIFGLEGGALLVTSALAGAALVAWGLAGVTPARRAAGWALGAALPPLLLALESAAGLLPFAAGAATHLAATGAAVLVGLAAWLAARGGREGLPERAAHLALGAALVGLPLLVGQLWARWDYHVTREQRARGLIEALERHRADHDVYPDELDELVERGYLGAIPEPATGFRSLDATGFGYRSFGTSFLLEFPAPRWVECAYTPPYEDEEEGQDALEEAWSCPSSPPQLW